MKNRRKNANSKRWQQQEDLYYYLSLILNIDKFLSAKAKKGDCLFKLISPWVGKDNIKCRSHHEKKVKKWKKTHGAQLATKFVCYKFYYDYLKIRLLDENHLRGQLVNFLNNVMKPRLKPNEYDDYYQKIEENLALLQLEQNYHLYKMKNTKTDSAQTQTQQLKTTSESHHIDVHINLQLPFEDEQFKPKYDSNDYHFSEEQDKFSHFSERYFAYEQ